MKAIVLLIAAAALLSGCVFPTKHQLEGKLPRVNADELTVDVTTIYGVSGTLTETDVRWDGDSKSVGSSKLRVTSPAGTYTRTITGASVGK